MKTRDKLKLQQYFWLIVLGIIAVVSFTLSVAIKNIIGSVWVAIGSVITSILAAKIIDINNRKIETKVLNVLAEIQKGCSKESVSITTVQKFLFDTKEEQLKNNDEVLILTNSLKGYDMTKPAIKTIAGNIYEGVKYIYFLPNDNSLQKEKDEFINLIIDEFKISKDLLPSRIIGESTIDNILKNLLFHTINIEGTLLYNFAIVKNKNALSGYWYLTKAGSNLQNDEGNDLVILSLNEIGLDYLSVAFDDLKTLSSNSI